MCGPKFRSMKIRADDPTSVRPELVEGHSAEEAEQGMAQMSERYCEGGDRYVSAE
jgi:hypothetical protein